MKIFSWVYNKLNGKQETNNTNISPPYKRETKEEFSDWPQSFLSIGTLGNKDLKEESKVQQSNNNNNNNNNNPQEYLTLEEVGQLEKELNALVSNPNIDILATLEASNLDNFNHHDDDDQEEEEEDHSNNQKHFSTINTLNNNNNNKAISKKSVSFLLKKMFVCGSPGLEPVSCLRNSLLSPSQTRMEKILRAILNKKIYPQNTSPPLSKNKYLESKHLARRTKKDLHHDDHLDDDDDGSEGSKWVKTDTDFIVLEI